VSVVATNWRPEWGWGDASLERGLCSDEGDAKSSSHLPNLTHHIAATSATSIPPSPPLFFFLFFLFLFFLFFLFLFLSFS